MSVTVAVLTLCVLMQFRNNWVYRARTRILIEDFQLELHAICRNRNYKRRLELLPSYDAMMLRFWIWNVEKFLPKEESK